MKLGHGIIKQQANLILDSEPSEQEVDSALLFIVKSAYEDWLTSERKRTWDQSKETHVIAIPGDRLVEVSKRLRAIGKELDLSIRIGRPIASERVMMYVPLFVLDRPPVKPKPQPVEPRSIVVSVTDWQDILFSLRHTIQHLINDPRRDDLSRLENRIMTVMVNELSTAERRELV